MKVAWEPEDIRVGRRVRRPGGGESWMLGYTFLPDHTKGFCKISLQDGMVQNFGSRAELAEHLNANGEHPMELVGEG